ncbi:exported protein of unknown function [Nitrosotalea devaniterrae]|uniref:Uncharacterized protein n=1 Tax=Nitrosotalea devaniterrae TaxID=1078905 RepID=A0A128A4A2_9ARCH|nr:exported protein of unknown function [Candidatus Nitrosotalea devanaterra]
MQSSAKTVLLTLSIMGIAMTFVLGQVVPVLAQTVPTSSNLVKRDYSYTDDQHLTARFGNSRVCGDHMCAPGEWTKLQESLNHAQIGHSAAVPAKTVSVTTNVTTTASTNSTVPVPSTPAPVTPAPTPVPTPPSSVCTAVKVALTNSTVSASTVAKIMSDLGCTS